MPSMAVNMEKAIMKAKKSPNDTGERQNPGSVCRFSKTDLACSKAPVCFFDRRRFSESSKISSSISSAVI